MPEIETHSEIPPISEEWEALALRIGAPPFLRPGWISAWWRVRRTGERLPEPSQVAGINTSAPNQQHRHQPEGQCHQEGNEERQGEIE